MPHLMLLCEYGTLSGGERSMLSTLPTVLHAGFSVSMITDPAGELAEAVREMLPGVRLIEWHELDTSVKGEARLAARREQLSSIIRQHQPDLLHANSLSMSRLSGPVVEQFHVPSIGHLRDIINISRTALGDINRHSRVLAVSEATRQHHVARGLEAERCLVQHNGVDLVKFQPRKATGQLLDELKIDRRDPLQPPIVIGAIGQIGLRKGFDVLVDAMRSLFERELPESRRLHCLIVGERWSDKDESRQFESDIQRAAKEGPLAGHLHLIGYHSDVARLMNELTILVHPARQEPLGRVLLEAAASGLPTVATDVGGTREIFPDAEMARLIPPDDFDRLADAIIELASDDSLRHDMGRAARARAEAAFDVRRAAEQLVGHYQEVLSS